MSGKRKHPFEVCRENGAAAYFPTLEAAERYAHKYVANSVDARGFAKRVEISREFHTIAEVRMDGSGRVWTDAKDCELI